MPSARTPHRYRWSLAIALAMLTVLLALPTAVPALPTEASGTRTALALTHLLNASKTVVRDGETYLVKIFASEGDPFGDILEIEISQKRDPDGVRFSSRVAEWSFPVNQVLFPGQSPPRLTTGEDQSVIRPFGGIKMNFDQASVTRSCSNKDALRKGSMTGTFRLVDPRLPFADHTLAFTTGMPNAALTSVSGDCVPPPTNACPIATQGFSASKGKTLLSSYRSNGAVTTGAERPTVSLKRNTTVIGEMSRSALVIVPAPDNFTVENDLTKVTADGGAFGFVHGPNDTQGRSVFTGAGDPTAYSYACGTDREAVFYSRNGKVTSNIIVNHLFGRDTNFANIDDIGGAALRVSSRAIA